MRRDANDEEKRTNEIGTIIPLLEMLPDIEGRIITVDALLTQRTLASYLLGRGADYLFTVKGNQPTLMEDVRLLFDEIIPSRMPDHVCETPKPEHGRWEKRSIWVSDELNAHAAFPGVAQVFAIKRETIEQTTGKYSCELAHGITSLTSQAASAQRVLTLNRGHWAIESVHHILDVTYDEDRNTIRTGHGPSNTTALRRFAIGLIKQRKLPVAETLRRLARNPRQVLDFLKLTANTGPRTAPA